MNLLLGKIRSGQVMITDIDSDFQCGYFPNVNCHSFIIYFVIIMDC